MRNPYQQLTLKERYQIEALCKLDYSARAIALQLGRGNKAISNELALFKLGLYCGKTAHDLMIKRRCQASKHTKCDPSLQETIRSLLVIGLSPEQISGRMKCEPCHVHLCVNTIYGLVRRLDWSHLLARKGKAYRKRMAHEAGVKMIPKRVDIDERPKIVDEKQEVGHWEGDTVHGQDGYLVTMVERVSKLLLTRRVKNKTKREVSRAIKAMMKPFKALCKTITFDNGGEFADHQSISKALKCRIYFAKPYHSWQRGLNENTNGLLRRFFPKGFAIGGVSKADIERAQLLINVRPRKALNYLNPLEFLTGKRVSLIVDI